MRAERSSASTHAKKRRHAQRACRQLLRGWYYGQSGNRNFADEMALALLDNEGKHDAAVRLQHAISIADREPIPQTIAEAEEFLNTPEARALMQRVLR